mmetsp:Transcript_15154/g.41666  ORF Transcript_15154/g.41666 Transcript_15154/m.41666 type:complete len:94 (-) Transcript_15154:231-512(-)
MAISPGPIEVMVELLHHRFEEEEPEAMSCLSKMMNISARDLIWYEVACLRMVVIDVEEEEELTTTCTTKNKTIAITEEDDAPPVLLEEIDVDR